MIGMKFFFLIFSMGIISCGLSCCKHPNATMSACPSPAQLSSPTLLNDCQIWCSDVASLKPNFKKQVMYIELTKDKDPNPSDFGSMIVSFSLEHHTADNLPLRTSTWFSRE
jgi:hypothetical protein